MRSTQRFEDSGCGRRSAEGEYYFSIRPHASKRKQKIEGKLASGAPTICSLREQAARPLFVLLENSHRAALGGRRILFLDSTTRKQAQAKDRRQANKRRAHYLFFEI